MDGQTRTWIRFIQVFDALIQVILDGSERSNYGGGSEPVGDHGEVCEVSLDAWVQDGGGSGVTQGRSVLVQQVHQFFCYVPGNKDL